MRIKGRQAKVRQKCHAVLLQMFFECRLRDKRPTRKSVGATPKQSSVTNCKLGCDWAHDERDLNNKINLKKTTSWKLFLHSSFVKGMKKANVVECPSNSKRFNCVLEYVMCGNELFLATTENSKSIGSFGRQTMQQIKQNQSISVGSLCWPGKRTTCEFFSLINCTFNIFHVARPRGVYATA